MTLYSTTGVNLNERLHARQGVMARFRREFAVNPDLTIARAKIGPPPVASTSTTSTTKHERRKQRPDDPSILSRRRREPPTDTSTSIVLASGIVPLLVVAVLGVASLIL